MDAILGVACETSRMETTPKQLSNAEYGSRQPGMGYSHGVRSSGSSNTARAAATKPEPVQIQALPSMIISSASRSALFRIGSSLP
jgi:hypothetical protein